MTKILAALLMVFLASCANITKDEVIDANQNLTRDDYRALRERATTETPPPIPDIKPIADDAPSALDDKTVSLSLTPDVPLKDVLMDLAQQAGLDLSLHPRVSGGISLNVNDQPLGLVLDRICELANLRWYDDNGFLHIEPDTPYWQNYALHYPSLSRNTESEVSIATNVFNDDVARQTNSTNSSRDISENNSRARVKSVAENNFWGEIEKSLGQILESDSDSDADSKSTSAKYTVNKQSGSVSVYGNQKVQNEVAVYLDDIQKKVGTQVLIDARIVEVELNENYRSGINWRTLLDNEANLASRFGLDVANAPFVSPATASAGVFTAAFNGADFSAILNLVREFGTTRILSAPRLTVMNNQTAILKVARNEVYFTTSAQFPTATNNNGVTVAGNPVFSSTPRTVPVGLVMTVQPAVNGESEEVTLNLRPTISRIVSRVEDPSIGLNANAQGRTATVQSLIPVLAVRELDSVLRVRSGEVAIMGGLMQDSSNSSASGIPGADETPLLSYLTGSKNENNAVSELVILLRATIVDSAMPDQADRALYRRYTRDPRAVMGTPKGKKNR